MVWVRLEGSRNHITKCIRDLNGRVHMMVRGSPDQVFIEIPEKEVGWLDKIKQDFSLKVFQLANPPVFFTAPCGIHTTVLQYHSSTCKKCRELRGAKPRAHNGKTVTRFTVPGLPDFSLNGLLSLLKGKRDEAMAVATELDAAIIAVEKLEGLDKQLLALQTEKAEQAKALQFFLKNAPKDGKAK